VTVFAVLVPTDFSTLFFETLCYGPVSVFVLPGEMNTRAARNLTEDLEAGILKLRR
jgi:hypothetical protein